MSEIRVERPGKSLAILARDKIVELIERKELVPGLKFRPRENLPEDWG